MFSKPLNARSRKTRQGFATAAARIFLKLLSMGGRWSLTARLGCQCANMLLAAGDRQEGRHGSCRHAHLTVWLRFGSSRCSAALICLDVTNSQVRRRPGYPQLETVQVRPSARELSEHDFSAREETVKLTNASLPFSPGNLVNCNLFFIYGLGTVAVWALEPNIKCIYR